MDKMEDLFFVTEFHVTLLYDHSEVTRMKSLDNVSTCTGVIVLS